MLLALSSCSKGDRAREAISFMPVAAKATKAIINNSTYPTTEAFIVSAYYGGTTPYFTDHTATYVNDSWVTTPAEYWPLSGQLVFHAYSPASAGLTIDADGVSATGYAITTPAQMETDLLYASATVADCSTPPGAVPLVFSHALSQVVFQVKAAAYYSENVSFALTALLLDGIYSVADFSAGTWSNWSDANTYLISSSTTTLTYDDKDEPETKTLGAFLFLPQTLSQDAALYVGYSIAQSNLGTLVNPPAPIPLGDVIEEWLPGKKYVITLSIGLNNLIEFTASAMNWTEEYSGMVVE